VRLVKIRGPHGPTWGRIDGDEVVLLEGGFAMGFTDTDRRGPFDPAELLAPVEPTKVVCVASNYAAHAKEMGKEIPDEPRLFLKPTSAIVGPEDPIRIPPKTTRVDPEGELGVVLRHPLSRATPKEAMKAVFGYTCVNDVTARDFQKKDGIFGRAKGFDSFCPVGPWIETDLDPRDLAVEVRVDGELRSAGRTNDMVFDVPTLLSFISSIMTLLPGDLVVTGTPPGVAPIVAGNRVAVTIEGIGTLVNPVVDREDR
jgi:2-keto-4-pentenoate hydratase/2-oxohepta-3-ene-1,7-dioic acid hydratase in catechol pathway